MSEDRTDTSNETRNRLAAAEFDIQKITEHVKTGSHPDVNET